MNLVFFFFKSVQKKEKETKLKIYSLDNINM